MDGAAIKAFVNSDGRINKFSFHGDEGIVRIDGEGPIIFDASDEDMEIDLDAIASSYKDLPDEEDEDHEEAQIIGGADEPTAIYISGNPLITLMVPLVIILGIVAFFVFTKRRKNS